MKIRKPYVANKFYPGSEDDIDTMLDTISKKEAVQPDMEILHSQIIGGILPHAGYIYSGYQAVHFLEYLKKLDEPYDTIFIICPDHSGLGTSVALDENDAWSTPKGNVEIDRGFYPYLNLPEDALPHQYEHSGEVIVPMLQHFIPHDFKIVPIAISQQNPETAAMTANAIIEANNVQKKKILLIVSSDFSHYVLPEVGEKLDKCIIERILQFDPKGVFEEVQKNNVSVCGYGPIMTLLEYAKTVSASPKIKLLKRGHSGEVVPSREVVFYTSFVIYE